MLSNQELGNKGENIATEWLSNKGYTIAERNWRHRRSEVDIIAFDGDILVFIEVKTRTSDFLGSPESFITHRKKEMLADAASAYSYKIDHQWEVRFDYISILVMNETSYEIKHFKDAFLP